MKLLFMAFMLFVLADESFEMNIESFNDTDCQRIAPYASSNGTDPFKYLLSLTKKSAMAKTASESIKFVCKPCNDDTFHHIDFYNRTSVNQLNTSCPLAFVVHGYFDGCSSGWTEELLRVWTDAECVNVCCVDWSVWAECNYWKCTGDYVQLVGEHLAETILFSATAYGMRTKSLVGHSLGAHVIGECGRNVNDPQVAECYSIDAAGVGYSQTRTNRPSRRIESSDCERVIALCCDKKVLGSDRTLGHLYVLVNNGTNQPQCEADDFSCDHSSCTSYFIESLRRNQSGSFTMINIETNATCVFNMESISECPDGNYTMTTSPCYPYVTT